MTSKGPHILVYIFFLLLRDCCPCNTHVHLNGVNVADTHIYFNSMRGLTVFIRNLKRKQN